MEKIAGGIDTGKLVSLLERKIARMKKKEKDARSGKMDSDRRFKSAMEFEFTVPDGYRPDDYLGAFTRKHKKEFLVFDDRINDKNYSGVTAKLAPGQKVKVKLLLYAGNVPSRDSLNLLKTEKAILAGAQGAALVYELAKKDLPREGVFVSFDRKEALWMGGKKGEAMVPVLKRFSPNKFAFVLNRFNAEMKKGDYLLCFLKGD